MNVREIVRRDFTVDVSLQEAWDRLSKVETWPSWAKHIKRVTLHPPGPLTEQSAGAFRLVGGARSTFRMEANERLVRWQWVGRFLTVDIHYDHRFDVIDEQHTRLTWTVMFVSAALPTIVIVAALAALLVFFAGRR